MNARAESTYPAQRWIDWVEQAATAVGVDPGDIDIADIHYLSKHVAHRLERPLAPVSTFILGLALGAAQGPATSDIRAELMEQILNTLPDEMSAD